MKKLLVLVVFCLGLATAANADLIALYEFEGGLSDSTGTQPDGIPVGLPGLIVDGERGNVLDVSPGNQVNCGNVTPSSVTDMTVGLWVVPGEQLGPNGSTRPLTSASEDYTQDPGWILFLRNDDWIGGCAGNNIWFRITGEDPAGWSWDGGDVWIHGDDLIYTPGEWIHLAFTFDATSRMITGYVNGLKAAEKLVTEPTRAVGSDVESLILGGQQEAFTGLLDDVFIADHAMTLGEIQDISGVPEPATIALLGLGGLALLRKKR